MCMNWSAAARFANMSLNLVHYIVVRRDLPIGVTYAQIAHAAGESFYQFGSGSSEKERAVSNCEAAGLSPARSSTFNPSMTIAVVLGARNESRLLKLEGELLAARVPHVAIREVDAPYAGQLMAIGLEPGTKHGLYPHIREYHMFADAPEALNA